MIRIELLLKRPSSLGTIRYVRIDFDDMSLRFGILIVGNSVNGVMRERNGVEVRVGEGVDG